MAAIDKTYVTKEELLEAISWAKEVGEVSLENGYKFYPLNFICYYNDIDNIEDKDIYVLWNTPSWFDRWLWLNCPLSFIKERIEEVYDEEYIKKFENWKYIEPVKVNRKYTFLETPEGYGWKFIAKGNGEKPSIYIFNIKYKDTYLGYNWQTDTWGEKFDMLPFRGEFEWRNKVPSKKAILRLLIKWNLPSGSIVRIKNLHYYAMDYKILVK
jgi:hypothetical protein